MRRLPRALFSIALTAALTFSAAARADEERAAFATPHPLALGGWCDVVEVHTHDAPPPPEIAYLFRPCADAWCFVGDPMPFGYARDAFAFDGHHPVVVAPTALFVPVAPVVVEPAIVVVPTVVGPSAMSAQAAHDLGYCYLAGLHYHAYAPDPSLAAWYAFWSGAWVYRGPVRVDVYKEGRERYERREPTWQTLPAYRNAARRSAALYSASARRRLAASFGRLRQRAVSGAMGGGLHRRTTSRASFKETRYSPKR